MKISCNMRIFSAVLFCAVSIAHGYNLYRIDDTEDSNSLNIKGLERFPLGRYAEENEDVLYDLSKNEGDNTHLMHQGVPKKSDTVSDRKDDTLRKRARKTFILIGHYMPRNYSEDDTDKGQPLDSWSVIWYIASFGGLIAFFLVVSCSEWCCRRNVRNNSSCRREANNSPSATVTVPDTPPPSYDHFAPPSYESIMYNSRGEKSEYDIYVVPVHALGSMLESKENHIDAPPSYVTASSFSPACLPSGLGEISPVRANNSGNNNALPAVHSACSQTAYPIT